MAPAPFNRLLGVPNLLTLLRLGALVPTILLFRHGHHVAATALFAAAMATDVLDGRLAARLDQRTALGLYLDPVVDKILVLVLLYELAGAGIIDGAVAHLALARELLQNAVRNVAATRGQVVGANWMGKTKAALQTVVVAAGLLAPAADGWGALAVRWGAWAVLFLAWVFFFVFVAWNRDAILGPRRTDGITGSD